MARAPAGPARLAGRVRPLRPGDDADVRRLFRSTLGLGRPLPFDFPDLAVYEQLCLGWYLGPGRGNAAVLDDGGTVRGYTLVCTDAAAYRAWATPRALAWTARSAALLAARRYDAASAAFVRLRIRDGWEAWRGAPPAPQPVHMHFNVERGARTGVAGLQLADHVDRLCLRDGHPGWFGEINGLAGRRVAALEHLGGEFVHSQPNRTLTWLAGRPVDRLTVQRHTLPATWQPLLPG